MQFPVVLVGFRGIRHPGARGVDPRCGWCHPELPQPHGGPQPPGRNHQEKNSAFSGHHKSDMSEKHGKNPRHPCFFLQKKDHSEIFSLKPPGFQSQHVLFFSCLLRCEKPDGDHGHLTGFRRSGPSSS